MNLRILAFMVGLANAAWADDAYDCVIEPAVVVELASQVGGLLESVSVARGDIVSAGDEVARLRSDVERSSVRLFAQRASSDGEVMAQMSRLKLAQARADRLRRLVEREIASAERLEEADVAVEVALRELALAELRRTEAEIEHERAVEVLNRRVIRSPIDGVVIGRLLFSGEFADQDTPIASIAQLDPLFVEAFLPASEYGSVSVGTIAEVALQMPFDTKVDGRVTVVDRVFDAASGSFGVRVEIANTDLSLPAGQRCKLRIVETAFD